VISLSELELGFVAFHHSDSCTRESETIEMHHTLNYTLMEELVVTHWSWRSIVASQEFVVFSFRL